MMELVKSLRGQTRSSQFNSAGELETFMVEPSAMDIEAADAIEQLCERLEGCWEKYEGAAKAEREACALVVQQLADYAASFGSMTDTSLFGVAVEAIRARSKNNNS